MDQFAEGIATHALATWAMLLVLACFAGDLAWRWNRRQHAAALSLGNPPVVIRGRTTIVLLVATASLFATLAATVGVGTGGWLSQFDAMLASALHSHMQETVLLAVAAVSHLGDVWSVTAAAFVMLLVLLMRREWRLAAVWTIALAGIMPINGTLKSLFQRTRPLHDNNIIVENGWSFPSGHAFGAMVLYGMLAYVLIQLLPARWHRVVIAFAVAMTGVIGLSRIVLQVHYFSDVMAGYVAGLTWLLACIALAEWWRLRTVR